MSNKLVGFSALQEKFDLHPIQPLTSTCLIAKTRSVDRNEQFRVEKFLPSYEPEDTTKGHFEFEIGRAHV